MEVVICRGPQLKKIKEIISLEMWRVPVRFLSIEAKGNVPSIGKIIISANTQVEPEPEQFDPQKHSASARLGIDPASYAGTMTLEELRQYHMDEHFGPEVLVELQGNLRLR